MQEKTHYIVITAIIKNNDEKYLICKRSSTEKVFPNKWCVPGGKIEQKDFINLPKDTKDHWFDVFEKGLARVKEETNLDIENIGYVSNLAFMRPNNYATIIVSMYADYKSGIIKLNESELVDYAWVSLDEAKNYDLIENIYEQIQKVDNMTKPLHQ